MKSGIIIYVHFEDRILLLNWRKYGFWCGLGEYYSKEKDCMNAVDTLLNSYGIKAENIKKVGKVNYNDKVAEKVYCYSVFRVITKSHEILHPEKVNNIKYVSQDKLLNYKLFPNLERYILNTYLKTKVFFDLEIIYSEVGSRKVHEYAK